MKWGQGDNEFNKILLNIFGQWGVDNRRLLFYSICIWVRLILYSSLFYLVKYDYIIYLIAILSLFAIFQLSKNINGPQPQWWSKKFQLIISICVFCLACYSIYNHTFNRNYIPLVLLFSLFGGIIQSFLILF